LRRNAHQPLCGGLCGKGSDRNRVVGRKALMFQDEEIDKELIATVAKLMNRP
jgi:hypothetical protein